MREKGVLGLRITKVRKPIHVTCPEFSEGLMWLDFKILGVL